MDFAYFGPLWRLLTADDPPMGVFLYRDADDLMDEADEWVG